MLSVLFKSFKLNLNYSLKLAIDLFNMRDRIKSNDCSEPCAMFCGPGDGRTASKGLQDMRTSPSDDILGR